MAARAGTVFNVLKRLPWKTLYEYFFGEIMKSYFRCFFNGACCRRFQALFFVIFFTASCGQNEAIFEVLDTTGLCWFKGNTHAHTTKSDGDSSPEVVAKWYKKMATNF